MMEIRLRKINLLIVVWFLMVMIVEKTIIVNRSGIIWDVYIFTNLQWWKKEKLFFSRGKLAFPVVNFHTRGTRSTNVVGTMVNS